MSRWQFEYPVNMDRLPDPANRWPDIIREYPDMDRPGLVHRVRENQIWLDPEEMEISRRHYDFALGVK